MKFNPHQVAQAGLVFQNILLDLAPGDKMKLQDFINNPKSKVRTKVAELMTVITWVVLDLAAKPYVPDGWEVDSHKNGDQFVWDPTKVELYLSENQKDGNFIEGYKLRKELENTPVFNANLLDYLFSHQHLIPEDWKKDEKGNERMISFWGTIYRDHTGKRYVRQLWWCCMHDTIKGSWLLTSEQLSRGFNDKCPAARLVS